MGRMTRCPHGVEHEVNAGWECAKCGDESHEARVNELKARVAELVAERRARDEDDRKIVPIPFRNVQEMSERLVQVTHADEPGHTTTLWGMTMSACTELEDLRSKLAETIKVRNKLLREVATKCTTCDHMGIHNKLKARVAELEALVAKREEELYPFISSSQALVMQDAAALEERALVGEAALVEARAKLSEVEEAEKRLDERMDRACGGRGASVGKSDLPHRVNDLLALLDTKDEREARQIEHLAEVERDAEKRLDAAQVQLSEVEKERHEAREAHILIGETNLKLLEEIDDQSGVINTLRAEVESYRLAAQEGQPLPCGHREQYAYSPDGKGAKIVCLCCRNKTLREALQKARDSIHHVYVSESTNIYEDSEIVAFERLDEALSETGGVS